MESTAVLAAGTYIQVSALLQCIPTPERDPWRASWNAVAVRPGFPRLASQGGRQCEQDVGSKLKSRMENWQGPGEAWPEHHECRTMDGERTAKPCAQDLRQTEFTFWLQSEITIQPEAIKIIDGRLKSTDGLRRSATNSFTALPARLKDQRQIPPTKHRSTRAVATGWNSLPMQVLETDVLQESSRPARVPDLLTQATHSRELPSELDTESEARMQTSRTP